MADQRFEHGPADKSMPMDRMMLVLKRSPEQDEELAALNQGQNDLKSADYHHWLHADEFGKRFGPSDSDMNQVTTWLRTQGFEIYDVSKGRTSIQFSGTVKQVEKAFHVEMHMYMVHGKMHMANDRDPQIPKALAPVVEGIASLHNFFAKPQSVFGNYVKKDLKTGKLTNMGPAHPELKATPLAQAVKGSLNKDGVTPQLTYTPSGDTYPHEEMTPFDFATVYNILPSWNAGTLGTGVSVAISGVSDISAADVTAFRKTFGLSGYAGTFKTIVNGTDPGADGGGGQGENTLDVEMAGATAPNSQVILVVSANTSTTGGDELSDEYIIDHEVAPIMSASYGECELNLGSAGNSAINAIWQQGATEGISIFESSGDQGSAGCSNSDQAGPNADETGLQVNGIASSPYLTAVGGTDFTWSFVSGGPAKYWNTTNTSTGENAKGYLPEVPWNSTCTNPLVYPIFTNGYTSTEQFCNALIGGDYEGLIVITGGSGGVSHCTTGGTTNATCTGGYAKPSWQTGLGVPNDGHRDLPDVSLFASGGFPDGIVGSAILDCEASSGSPEKTCDYTNPDYIIYQETGGTSASSPLMAGIMALVVQKTGAAQGLANPTFYSLYTKQVAAGTACDSSTVTNASTCVFNDVSSGTNAQVCISGDSDCVTNTAGDEVGILSGYAATKGYDLGVGLGSMNVANLLNAWPSTTTAPAVTLSPTGLTFASTAVGVTTAAQVVTVKNSGTAALTLTSETITGTNATSFVKSATTCGTSLAVGATCTVSVEFKPTAAGTLTGSLAVADNATGSPQAVTLTGTATAAPAPAVTLSPTSLTFASTAVGVTTAAQVVTVKNSGTAALTLTSETITGTNATSFIKSATTCGTSLAVGATCTVSVEFKPTVAGTLTGSLAIADNATGSPQAVTLSGTATAATAPAVTLSPTSLTFASTAVGITTAAQVVTVKNSGTAALTLTSETITGTNATSFIKSATTCGASLAVGATCTVSVEFKPTVAGTLTGSLAIADNATGSPQAVTLSGTATAATAPAVTLSPTSLTFASTTVGVTTAAQVVTVKNSGAAALTLTSETITGTNATSFIKSATTCGTSLAVGATCTVSVEFKPTMAGTLTGSLAIADNATGSPQAVTLTGTATAPAVTLSPTSLTFASTVVGVTTAAQVVTVKNSGTAALTLTSETITGTNATSFIKSATTCGTSLAVGATCTVSVEFKPTAAGTLVGSLAIADNATGSPQAATLSGTATAAAAPAVTLSPTSLTFASTVVGVTTAAQVVTVKNSGTAALTLTSETITGTNATSFIKSATTCGTSLAVGATCTVSVEFKPTAAGALTGSLAIADNATGSPQAVTLSGTGTAAAALTVTLSPTSLSFANTVVGTTADAQTVTLTNTGTSAVALSSIAISGASYVDLNNCGTTLASKAACSIYVAFRPTAAGAQTGALSVTDNATGSPQKVTFTGTGVAVPSVKLSVTTIAFPTTLHGTVSAAQPVALTNTGQASLDLTSIMLTGTNPTDFQELNTCGPTLAAGASCTVYVAFAPASAAAFKGTLSIADSGTGSPQMVTLSGTGN